MGTVFVLLMVFSTSHSYGGVAVIQQEFSSRENCELAMAELSKEPAYGLVLRSKGCFRK